MRVVIKEPGQAPQIVSIDGSLKSMQKLIGGHIQHVSIKEGIGLLVHEEGKILGLDKNFHLSKYNDTICGPVVFVGEIGEEFTSLTEADIEYISANFGH